MPTTFFQPQDRYHWDNIGVMWTDIKGKNQDKLLLVPSVSLLHSKTDNSNATEKCDNA